LGEFAKKDGISLRSSGTNESVTTIDTLLAELRNRVDEHNKFTRSYPLRADERFSEKGKN
jgi:hypothetical protein